MPPPEKKFVKYTFDEAKNSKKEPKEPRQNFKQKDSNVNNQRPRRHVSYTQKSTLKQNVLTDMINSFVPVAKPSKQVQQLLKNFPKYFSATPKQPQSYSTDSLNSFLILLGKKPQKQARTYAPVQIEQQQDPDWDSSSDYEGGIQSKKIDQNIVEKVQQKYNNVKQLLKDQLKRHQKDFLQDYYRQKHQEQLQKQQKAQSKEDQKDKKTLQQKEKYNEFIIDGNDWTDYQEKQVNQFVNMGFIQKIQGNEEDQDFDFSQGDFSVEDQKQEHQAKSQSSSGDEDQIFGDVGPTTIVKKKQQIQQNKAVQTNSNSTQGTVVINHHVFSRIAQIAGIPPGACIWIIRNKNQRYKVTTQFMDQMYRVNKICDSLPYISLNHSQFVHNNDVEKQRSIQVFKKFNARKRNYNNNYQNQNYANKPGKSYGQEKRKFNYKPGTQNPNQKTHLNKK